MVVTIWKKSCWKLALSNSVIKLAGSVVVSMEINRNHYFLNILRMDLLSPGAAPPKLQLYGHLPPITKTIKVRQARYAGHCWRSRDELISNVLLWTPSHGRAKAGQPAQTYIQQHCKDTDVALKTDQKWWMIGRGGERGSGISVLMARQDDDRVRVRVSVV